MLWRETSKQGNLALAHQFPDRIRTAFPGNDYVAGLRDGILLITQDRLIAIEIQPVFDLAFYVEYRDWLLPDSQFSQAGIDRPS